MQPVSVIHTKPVYPQSAPYHPSQAYPEYPFPNHIAREENAVYDGVRQLLRQLGYDKEHYGTKAWNPLGWLIKPGMKVVLKPNFVLSAHSKGLDLFSIITHPSVLRAVADYCWIALQGKGAIIIADAPQYDCNFAQLVEATRLDEVVEFYAGFSGPRVELRDLRVVAYDPLAIDSAKAILGSAMEYVHSPTSLLEQAQLCVVTLRNAEFKEALENYHPDGPMTVVDCWRTLDPEKLDKRIRLVALGRSED